MPSITNNSINYDDSMNHSRVNFGSVGRIGAKAVRWLLNACRRIHIKTEKLFQNRVAPVSAIPTALSKTSITPLANSLSECTSSTSLPHLTTSASSTEENSDWTTASDQMPSSPSTLDNSNSSQAPAHTPLTANGYVDDSCVNDGYVDNDSPASPPKLPTSPQPLIGARQASFANISRAPIEQLDQLLADPLNLSPEEAKILAEKVNSALQTGSTELIIHPKKCSQTAIGFSISGNRILFRTHFSLGSGCYKATQEAYLLDLQTSLITEIIFQKPKKNTDPSLVSLVEREAMLAYKMKHPNIIETLDYYTYYSSKHLQKIRIYAEKADYDLNYALNKPELLSFDEKVAIIRGTLSAVEFIHAAGFIHNDLKPANILIKGKQAKVADFGVFTPFNQRVAAIDPKLLSPEQKAEKAALTPEQIAARVTVTGTIQSEVYMIGLLLWQCFQPHPEEKEARLKHLFNNSHQPDFEALFEGWQTTELASVKPIIEQCLDPDPAKRPSIKDIQIFFDLILTADA